MGYNKHRTRYMYMYIVNIFIIIKCVLFWDREGGGTPHMLGTMRETLKNIKIRLFKNESQKNAISKTKSPQALDNQCY